MAREKFNSVQEIKEYFDSGKPLFFDAEYSPQTKRLVEDMGAKGAHLNIWWVRTSTDWKCPSCLRSKQRIAKLDSRGFISGHLHEHHDHMKDVVRKLFEEISSGRQEVVANELAERFAVRTAFAISAYDNTVICSDCNKADGIAKKMVKAHKDFSFSPSEIGRLIISTDNEEHKINQEIASAIWQESQDMFLRRMELARYIAELAASDSHWYQPSNETANRTKQRAQTWFRWWGVDQLDDEPERILYNPSPFKGNHSSWRLKPKPATKSRPTIGQIAHLANTRGRYWNRYEENWHCPCCSKSKYDCLKPSKNNPWVFEVKGILAHDSTEESLAKEIKVCNECFNTANHLGREAIMEVKEEDETIDVYFPHSLVTIEELKSVIEPRANSSHIINNDLAESVVKKGIVRIKSQDYHASPLQRA